MKYRVIIMVPTAVEFETEGPPKEVANRIWALCNGYNALQGPDDIIAEARPHCAWPLGVKAAEPLVFDPPPMVA